MSSIVTFYLFVLPTLRKMAGWLDFGLTQISVKVRKIMSRARAVSVLALLMCSSMYCGFRESSKI